VAEVFPADPGTAPMQQEALVPDPGEAEVAAIAAPAAPAAPEAKDDPNKPRKKGWWSLGR
jgi:ribonuclease E